jgi:hypothetical protein
MSELFNRLGSVGLVLIAGALIVGGLMGGAVVHRIDRGAIQSVASQQHEDQSGQQQGASGDKEDSKATKTPSKSSSTSHKSTKPATKKTTKTTEKDSD